MAKKKMQCEIKSFGIYTRFDKKSKTLPRFLERTTTIPCKLDIEFGYVLHIKKGKGQKLDFVIDHPPFKDESGKISPPFDGEMYIDSNDYKFFLGDTIWPPIEDKTGEWTLTTKCQGKLLAQKTLTIVKEET
ncbi:MAG: DUF3859 domain-containing protein [Planctomycetes bacterium]|nr:DUF3859 domain-containing protein [Planctomycetota bacterium]